MIDIYFNTDIMCIDTMILINNQTHYELLHDSGIYVIINNEYFKQYKNIEKCYEIVIGNEKLFINQFNIQNNKIDYIPFPHILCKKITFMYKINHDSSVYLIIEKTYDNKNKLIHNDHYLRYNNNKYTNELETEISSILNKIKNK